MSPSGRGAALITGASSGIGAALARLFAANGFDLVLVARRRDRLVALAATLPTRTAVIAEDLAAPDAAKRIVEQVRAGGHDVSILVNNAGFAMRGAFADQDPDRLDEMIAVNIAAATGLTRLLVPDLVARGGGKVLNVASAAGFLPGPFMAVYYATKAYVVSFSEALAEELRGSGVTVTCLCPGPVDTEFAAVAGLENSPLFRNGAMNADKVARIGYRATMRGRRLVVTSRLNAIGVFLIRFAPKSLLLRITRRLQS